MAARTEPSGARRRRADAERSIAGILAAAHRLFTTGKPSSMTDIAAEAGVGRVTLYSHFPSREDLIEAVVSRAISHTDEVLNGLGLEAVPPVIAVERLVRSSWPILDAYRKVRAVAVAELGPEVLRRHHDGVVHHLERLIHRGQREGAFRTDLSDAWLVASFYAVLHAAADEVEAGRISAAAAPDVLVATVRSLLMRA